MSLTICQSVRIIALDFFYQSVRTLVLKSVFQCVRIIFLESVESNRKASGYDNKTLGITISKIRHSV